MAKFAKLASAAARKARRSDDGGSKSPFDTPESERMRAAQAESRGERRPRPEAPDRAAVSKAMRQGREAADRAQSDRAAQSPWAASPFDTPQHREMVEQQKGFGKRTGPTPSAPRMSRADMAASDKANDRAQAARVASSPWAGDDTPKAAGSFPKQAKRRRKTSTAAPAAVRGAGVFSADPEIRRQTMAAADALDAETKRSLAKLRRGNRY